MSNWKFIMALLTLNAFMMSTSYNMPLPFLPVYLSELGAPEETLRLWSGVIYAVSFAVCALMAPLWGKLTDSFGPRSMLLRAGVLMSLSYVFNAIVQDPWQFLASRAFQGFASGLYPACLAILSGTVPKDKLGFSMGLFQSGMVTGTIIGPLLGGVVAESLGIRMAFWTGFGGYSLLTVLSWMCLKDPPVNQELQSQPQRRIPTPMRKLLSNRNILILMLITIMLHLVIMLLQPVITLYVKELKESSENLMLVSGLVFALPGFAAAISAPWWGRYGQNKGFQRVLWMGLFANAAVLLIQSLPLGLMVFSLLQIVAGFAFSGIIPAYNALLTEHSDPKDRGSVYGLMFAFQHWGATLGPILGGILATLVNLQSVFAGAGLSMLLLGIWLWRCRFDKTPADTN